MGCACKEATVHDTLFCSSHRKHMSQSVQHDLNRMLKQEDCIKHTNIYVCLDNLWSYNTANEEAVKEAATKEAATKETSSLGKYRLDKAFLAVELIGFVADHSHVNMLGDSLGINIRKIKTAAIFDIVSLFWNIWLIGQDVKKTHALSVVQRRWRERQTALMGPWPNVASVNDTDSFTQEKLQNIYNRADKLSVFSYRDTNGNVYGFCGRSLGEYVFKYNNTYNPFTREGIPAADIKRLHKLWLTYANPSEQALPIQNYGRPQLQNPSIAFTEVVSVLESRFNIYCQPQWLLSLNEFDIMGIFARFHGTIGIGHTRYMNRQAEEDAFDLNPPTSSQLVLATEMLYMFSCEPSPSRIVYSLIQSIAHFSIHLQASLPEWVFDATM